MGFLAEVQAFCWTGGADCLCGCQSGVTAPKGFVRQAGKSMAMGGRDGKKDGSATTMEVDLEVDPKVPSKGSDRMDGQA